MTNTATTQPEDDIIYDHSEECKSQWAIFNGNVHLVKGALHGHIILADDKNLRPIYTDNLDAQDLFEDERAAWAEFLARCLTGIVRSRKNIIRIDAQNHQITPEDAAVLIGDLDKNKGVGLPNEGKEEVTVGN